MENNPSIRDLYGPMQVRVTKLHPEAVIPKYAKDGDAGLDLIAVTKEVTREQTVYGTGLAIEIPDGHVGLIFPRSSIKNYTLNLSNAVGVVDSGYRGEIKAVFNHVLDRTEVKTETRAFWDHQDTLERFGPIEIKQQAYKHYEVGDKIMQLVIIPYPQIELVESESLSETARGEGGFGSSGR